MPNAVTIAESLQYAIPKEPESRRIPEEYVLLRVADVCRATGYSKATIHRMIHAGDMPSVNKGRNVRIPLLGLRAWIDRNTNVAKQATASEDQHG